MSSLPEITIDYQRVGVSLEEEQEILDDIFEILFSEIIRELTTTMSNYKGGE